MVRLTFILRLMFIFSEIIYELIKQIYITNLWRLPSQHVSVKYRYENGHFIIIVQMYQLLKIYINRNLYFFKNNEYYYSIPKDLLNILVSMVIQTDRTKVKECMLCKRILMELLPLDKKSEDVVEKFQDKVPCNTHLQLMKVLMTAKQKKNVISTFVVRSKIRPTNFICVFGFLTWAVWSGSTLGAQTCLSTNFGSLLLHYILRPGYEPINSCIRSGDQ